MKRHSCPGGTPSQPNGFTLTELLVVSFLLALFVISAASISNAMLNSNLKLLQTIALRDNWKKIAQLINADIQEACSASVSSNILTLRVLATPETTANLCSGANASTITYQKSGSNLVRTGPMVKQDGTLSSGGTFLPSATQTLTADVSAFTPSIASGSSFNPTFSLTLSRAGNSYSGSTTGSASADSRARVRAF